MNVHDIKHRWETRVVPNGWDTDKHGGYFYLEKYGNNIGVEKLKMLANYADRVGSHDFANIMRQAAQDPEKILINRRNKLKNL